MTNELPSYNPLPNKPDCFDNTEFEFKIVSITKKTINDQPDVITSITWAVSGTYDGITEIHDMKTEFPEFILSEQDTFIDYNNLTEEIVKSWIKNDYTLYNIKCSICNKIESQLNQNQVITELPWNTQ